MEYDDEIYREEEFDATEFDKRLKPCPFCGNKAFIHSVPPHKHYFAKFVADCDGNIFIECTKCSCACAYEYDMEKAIEKWNTRWVEQ